jgi:hypothetical protein
LWRTGDEIGEVCYGRRGWKRRQGGVSGQGGSGANGAGTCFNKGILMRVKMSTAIYDYDILQLSWRMHVLTYWLIVLGIVLLISCNAPTQSDKNYYDDLTKGTENNLTENEQGIINAIIEYRANGRSDEIAIIADSTRYLGMDTSRMASKDTFPDTLVNMLRVINDRSYYIGNSILNISFDYRYIDQTYLNTIGNKNGEMTFWSEFYSRFPQSHMGILSFSKIVINADSTKAIALVMWRYGDLGADGGAMSFRKENGKWKAIAYFISIMS